jgi:aryl carrier-like protein
VSEDDRASQVAGLGFDAAVWEVWPNLCAGATIVLVDEEVRTSPERLRDWILRKRVTIGFVPTVHAGAMMRMPWPQATALRILLTGGDTLHQGPVADLPFVVVNNYGPTECTVVSTSTKISAGEEEPPSIGCAIQGARVYLLDESGIPVADGVAGEIYVGGSGVGRGYRNMRDATARSFLRDPFAEAPGARMFRTGDRALRLADGELRFLGRQDRQVKIRGQRLELDEIGALLSQHPAVEFATATVVSAGNGEKHLVGYILPRREMKMPTIQDLQAYLRQRLPEYMVPATVVRLEEIPLSPSGKVDYGRLPRPEAASAVAGQLLVIARQLLESNMLREDENLFLAGGDSLLGMQLAMKVQSEFGLKIDLQQLFEAPTVLELSLLLERLQHEQRLTAIWKEVLCRETGGVDEDFFLIGGSERRAAAVCERMATETGSKITAGEFRSHPTIRRQAELALGWMGTPHSLPPGVLALKLQGNRTRIFWAHYLSANLARAIGDE